MCLRFVIHALAAWAAIVPTQAFSTTIIAVWLPDRVMIGADSKVSMVKGTVNEPMCKIGVANNVLFAISGLRLSIIVGNAFDTYEIARQALLANESLDFRIQTFEKNIIEKLSAMLSATKAVDPAGYPLAKNEAAIGIVFAAYINGRARMEVRDIRDTGGATIDVRVAQSMSCPGDAQCARRARVVMLGQNEESNRITSIDPLFWQRRGGVAQGIEYLITQESAADPTHVGPPISIVEVAAAGVNWVSRGICRSP
jgi:hypothetical protein